MELVNLTTGIVLAETVEKAQSFTSRFKGLMLRQEMPTDFAMHLTPCKSIHTFFMRFSIDVLYLNDEHEVVGLEENLKAGQLGKRIRGAHSVIELPAGVIGQSSTEIGHVMTFQALTQNRDVKN